MSSQIKLEGISKQFLIPHQKRDTLKEGFLSLFRKTTYEKFNALSELTFSVNRGEFVGIIGRNGSGKSTLLKIISGIYQPDQGKVEYSGRLAPFLELGIGFQQELSGRENIYLNGSLLGLNRKQINARFKDLVDFAEVGNFIDLKVKNFSSGMRARLAFAIAREADADIYLFDEILAVGDESFQKKCLDVFREWKKDGKTIMFVSHNPALVSEFCDRALFLESGRLISDGQPNEVIAQYHQQISG